MRTIPPHLPKERWTTLCSPHQGSLEGSPLPPPTAKSGSAPDAQLPPHRVLGGTQAPAWPHSAAPVGETVPRPPRLTGPGWRLSRGASVPHSKAVSGGNAGGPRWCSLTWRPGWTAGPSVSHCSRPGPGRGTKPCRPSCSALGSSSLVPPSCQRLGERGSDVTASGRARGCSAAVGLVMEAAGSGQQSFAVARTGPGFQV